MRDISSEVQIVYEHFSAEVSAFYSKNFKVTHTYFFLLFTIFSCRCPYEEKRFKKIVLPPLKELLFLVDERVKRIYKWNIMKLFLKSPVSRSWPIYLAVKLPSSN